MSHSQLLERILAGDSLKESEAVELMYDLADGEMTPAFAGALLAGLRAKGETADEIRGFAIAMRELALHPAIPSGSPAVDTVGTGGDGSGSLNLSTGTGLLAAACGARVVKHGNRSISSKSGSADMLEQLGMLLPLDEQAAIKCLLAINFTFLFAPIFHPAMKAIMPVRTALGVRTFFNILGPLTNPAAPPFQLIGAFSKNTAKLMADTLAGMPIERAFVVYGEPGWDEATPAGEFILYDTRRGSVEETIRTPEQYGLNRCKPEELVGDDAKHNAKELIRVFDNEDKGPHRDALLMGTSLVMEVLGIVRDAKEGVEMAMAAIEDGAAKKLLDDMKTHFEKV
jgi:anthranilate phosphoribosyltransferase